MTAPIVLRIPHEPPFHGVARLVVGGLAARLDLTYEHLEDLQLALASVLENGSYVARPEVVVELTVGEEMLGMAIGPLNGAALRADLESANGNGITLGRLLRTVAERVEVDVREDGEWLSLEKRMRTL